MWKSTEPVALEQHMDAITVAVAAPGRQPSEFCGDVPSTPEAVRKLVGRLDDGKMDLRFCYEAGPCGYGLYRQLTMMGYDCSVVAPSLSPRRPGERIKTDRRDALTLARQHRSGDLVAVWVPVTGSGTYGMRVMAKNFMRHLPLGSSRSLMINAKFGFL